MVPSQPTRGLTIRSFVVAIVSMLLMGIWIQYEELYNTYGGPLAENSPPNSAVGVIGVLLLICAVLYKIRRPLRLVAAELVVIYAALVLAAPLMTQGMWHRIFGLVAAVPHNQDFKTYDSLPLIAWPHGDNLCVNGQFKDKLTGFTHTGGGALGWEDATIKDKQIRTSPVLSNGTAADSRTALQWSINRYDKKGKQVLVPGESCLFSMLVRAQGFTKGSSYFVTMQADDGVVQTLLVSADVTQPSFAFPGGFQRVGLNPVKIPSDLKNKLNFAVTLTGEGALALQDMQFFNVEAVEGAYAGRRLVTESNLANLDPSERDFLVVRPDNMFSWAGLKFLITGYIPLRQWMQPAMTWGLLVLGLFIGFLGMNVLMRKQWVEFERFTFPLTILPKTLFEETVTPEGKVYRTVFRNRILWAGFTVGLVLALLKGIQFYYPQCPAPIFNVATFGEYFTSPVIKAFLQNVGIGVGTGIGLSLCLLAIALLIETDILFSLWAFFILFQLWHLFGKAFTLTRYPGYPWEFQQAMGAFIGYALLAVFVGRHHLARVFRMVVGRGKPGEDASSQDEVVSYRQAVLLIISSLATLALWGVWTEMGVKASLLFFGYMLICGFAASKIRAECGAPFGYLTPYMGIQFMTALGGFAVFQSTGMLMASLASGFICTSVFLLIAPVQVEMMELGRHFKVRPRDVGAGLTLGVLGGLLIGGFVLLCWLYGFGGNSLKTAWPYGQNWYFNSFRAGEADADRAFAVGTLGKTPELAPFNVAQNMDAKGLTIGAGITGAVAFLRMKFMWFPFHPIGYVLASSYFMKGSWFVLFLAWLARLVLFRLGGAHVIRRGLVPFCVGMFLGCVASIVVFDVVGICLRVQGVTEVYSKIP
ncbi:MAG: DUF6785 family protein [bacterium]